MKTFSVNCLATRTETIARQRRGSGCDDFGIHRLINGLKAKIGMINANVAGLSPQRRTMGMQREANPPIKK